MTNKLTILFLALTAFLSCNISTKKNQDEKTTLLDTLQQNISDSTNPLEDILKTVPENIKPVFGYRFIISGDFDGDGEKEKFIEHFVSGLDNKETNKFYEGLSDYDQLVALTIKKEPHSFVVSDNKLIDTLHISSGGQSLGLSYLKNEGDIDGDGGDEISYVVNCLDWSNINIWILMSYKNGKWVILYSFFIWDWQLPDLPSTFNQYGLFGLEDKLVNTTDDKIIKEQEKELMAFKGLVKKIGTNKIQIIYNNVGILDTTIIDLKQKK